ncbi:hypothetical protein GLOTRDRAFT_114527 [Gloeophyllum trabeum ATCC 11539]|uniref:Monopolin complex subunit Csm1/Pcs1 C-terminal domain-containing protein n=1 Tax=Gloeophyllum trabeum (strain ATCC 11539 / FP-39264 / Madison 617) TaxID=670483 RepID=S7QEW9_GLOTA|nr:uncharacterized protein GLOTRDRAFT_114527 [Gloeophyllum trabeum ATCC 11539]EPQ57972.1 hypothetical protein GLOTRDRAFT_114527 [Gloeophyllum trabeum ATCC 11539]
MTREAVEEEKRSLEQEVAKWKEAANQEKQRRAELEQLEKELRFELNAEIERSKSLAAKGPSRDGPGSTTKGKFRGPGKEPTSMEGRVIRFYEDLTNLLVPKHYMEKSPHEGLPDEWCFSCVYTHAETSNALNFSLRLFSEPAPDGSDDLIDQVKYTPYELDKETDEFREKLGFFNTPFTFERSQLHVFLRSLGETVQNAAADQDNASENQGGEELVYPE